MTDPVLPKPFILLSCARGMFGAAMCIIFSSYGIQSAESKLLENSASWTNGLIPRTARIKFVFKFLGNFDQLLGAKYPARIFRFFLRPEFLYFESGQFC